MNGVSDTKDDEGALGGEWKALLGCVETSAGCFLDLADSHTCFADDGTDEDVRDEETEWVGLGVRVGGCFEGLLVEGSDDEAECFGNCIDVARDSKNALDCTSGILADSALGTCHLADL